MEACQAHYLEVAGSSPVTAISAETNRRAHNKSEMCGIIFTLKIIGSRYIAARAGRWLYVPILASEKPRITRHIFSCRRKTPMIVASVTTTGGASPTG